MTWIDLHIDTLGRMDADGADPLARCRQTHVDLPRLLRTGVRAAVWAAWVEDKREAPPATAVALRMLGHGLDLVARSRGRVRLVRAPSDLAACRAGQSTGMILGLEGAHPLQGSVELLEGFHALGVRVVTLTWNDPNRFACGCGVAQRHDTGLAPRGRKLIARLHELGMLLDLAHASPRTLDHALRVVRPPFLVSHTACAALHPHVRNLTDPQLRDVAAAGGLVGISVCPYFLGAEVARVRATQVADHVIHALGQAGVDSVAIGTDLDGIAAVPQDIRGVQHLPRIAAILARRGLSAREIERVCWRNAARTFREGLKGDAAAKRGR